MSSLVCNTFIWYPHLNVTMHACPLVYSANCLMWSDISLAVDIITNQVFFWQTSRPFDVNSMLQPMDSLFDSPIYRHLQTDQFWYMLNVIRTFIGGPWCLIKLTKNLCASACLSLVSSDGEDNDDEQYVVWWAWQARRWNHWLDELHRNTNSGCMKVAIAFNIDTVLTGGRMMTCLACVP